MIADNKLLIDNPTNSYMTCGNLSISGFNTNSNAIQLKYWNGYSMGCKCKQSSTDLTPICQSCNINSVFPYNDGTYDDIFKKLNVSETPVLAMKFYGISYQDDNGVTVSLIDTLHNYVKGLSNAWDLWTDGTFDLDFVTNFINYNICSYDPTNRSSSGGDIEAGNESQLVDTVFTPQSYEGAPKRQYTNVSGFTQSW